MKTKTLKKNKVNVVTLGCSKNIYDSEVLMGQLRANKFDVEHEGKNDDAAIVIINTCGFIENAKQEREAFSKGVIELNARIVAIDAHIAELEKGG